MIKVIYQDGTLGMVDPSILCDLIAAKTIKQFYRSEGWVSIATEPVRGRGGSYKGNERRNRSPEDSSKPTGKAS